MTDRLPAPAKADKSVRAQRLYADIHISLPGFMLPFQLFVAFCWLLCYTTTDYAPLSIMRLCRATGGGIETTQRVGKNKEET